MFVDASAIVAILTDEPEADDFAALLAGAEAPITSAVAIFESVAAVARRKNLVPTVAHELVADFLQSAGISTVNIGAAEGVLAVMAFNRFGKGRGNPAQLNMGDCFAYACALAHGTSLLFKGDDFSETDIEAAVGP